LWQARAGEKDKRRHERQDGKTALGNHLSLAWNIPPPLCGGERRHFKAFLIVEFRRLFQLRGRHEIVLESKVAPPDFWQEGSTAAREAMVCCGLNSVPG